MIQIETLDWSTHQTIIRGIRTRVFVEEQNIPEADEWDEDDAAKETLHWGITQDEQLAGYVRLVHPQVDSYTITRLAVDKPSRLQGFGKALVKKASQYALSHHCNTLSLHAQLDAVSLYESLGFRKTGEQFDEAGIAHQAMTFSLGLPSSFEHIFSNQVIRLSYPSDYIPHAVNIMRCSSHTINICSRQLRDDIFAKDAFVEALSVFARSDRRAKVKILLHSSKSLSRRAQALIELSRRLSSKISIQTLTSDTENLPDSFICGDNKRLIYFNDESKTDGFCCYRASAESVSLYDSFEHAWNHQSKVDPNLKQLSV